jgi:hypothetical protein
MMAEIARAAWLQISRGEISKPMILSLTKVGKARES